MADQHRRGGPAGLTEPGPDAGRSKAGLTHTGMSMSEPVNRIGHLETDDTPAERKRWRAPRSSCEDGVCCPRCTPSSKYERLVLRRFQQTKLDWETSKSGVIKLLVSCPQPKCRWREVHMFFSGRG